MKSLAVNQFMGGYNKNKKGGGKADIFFKLLNEKKSFLALVFSNLIVQLGITYFVMMNYGKQASTSTTNTSKKGSGSGSGSGTNKSSSLSPLSMYGIFFIQILIIFILALVSMPSWIKFIIFSIFSGLWGILLSGLSVDVNLIHMAVFGAMAIFGAMIILGALLLSVGIRLGLGVGLFLFFALLLLIIVQVVLMFTSTYSVYIKAISAVSLLIFSLYVIYDTNRILQRDYYGDFITASMDYYLDILNIFTDLIHLGQN